jgi:hypothetical protein
MMKRSFEWTFAFINTWLLVGMYIDGWAHNHVISELDSPVNPWHLPLFGATLALTGFLSIASFMNHMKGLAWNRCLPPGYGVSGIGTIVLWVGVLLDVLWHSLFGIEANLGALISPTHLFLTVGMILIRVGPIRAACKWPNARPVRRGWVGLGPAIMSLAYLLAQLTFATQFASPLGFSWAGAPFQPGAGGALVGPGSVTKWIDVVQALGVAGIMLHTALVMGVVLLAVRQWGAILPFGCFTVILAIDGFLMTTMRDSWLAASPSALVAGMGLAGLLSDCLLKVLRPTAARPYAVAGFSFSVPVLVHGLYFAVVATSSSVWWSLPVWLGAIVIAGMIGFMLGYLMFLLPEAPVIRISRPHIENSPPIRP